VSNKTKNDKGIDIVMAIDVSEYAGQDLKPNRMEALKRVLLILWVKDLMTGSDWWCMPQAYTKLHQR
jgi:hypothetical protein